MKIIIVFTIYTNDINQFDIIDWDMLYRHTKIREKDVEKEKGVGRFMLDTMQHWKDLDIWGVHGIGYDERHLKDGRWRFQYHVHFWGDRQTFENPLHIFGLDGEYRSRYM
jgi:hypothetical protein